MANDSALNIGDTHGLIGNPIVVFNSLGPEVQGWIAFITGIAALGFLIVTIICQFGHGIGSNVSSIQRDSAGRSKHIMGMFYGIITVVLLLLMLGMLFAIYFS